MYDKLPLFIEWPLITIDELPLFIEWTLLDVLINYLY